MVAVRRTPVLEQQPQPQVARFSSVLIGTLCGAGASLAWAAGFVAAKHGISIGFAPADLALHRFLWSGLLLMPLVLRDGIGNLGGVGWGRAIIMSVLSGPPQAFIAYTGFILVPLGHGTTIQPATAALVGIVLAAIILRERLSGSRILGAIAITAGLMVFGYESLMTIGSHGVGGDLLFFGAGAFWAIFGILLRQWQISGTRVVAAVGALSVLVYAPFYFIFIGYDGILRMSLYENFCRFSHKASLPACCRFFCSHARSPSLAPGARRHFPRWFPASRSLSAISRSASYRASRKSSALRLC